MSNNPEDDRDTAYIIHPVLSGSAKNLLRDEGLFLEETAGLARAINLKVLDLKKVQVSKVQAGYFLGKGNREMLFGDIEKQEPDIVVFNHALSPVQQRNLEKQWQCKVIDRTGLILEIFGARAQTKEGKLQVELAALNYQRSRLVRSWTHLERQRGGAGFMGGPGETQIEIDRRLIGERITRLKKQLEDVRRTRDLSRQSRKRVPLPVVALVGYTNAGKSTLFNTLTDANVFAEDLPFATLDPTMRRVTIPGAHQDVILSDTVGFISDLPTHLIAAFRATLEQVVSSDVIAHIIDVSRVDYEAQRRDVIKILRELGVDYEQDDRVIEVFNKIDCLDEDRSQDINRKSTFLDHNISISAINGDGIDKFLGSVHDILSRSQKQVCFHVAVTDGKAISWLYEHSDVIEDHMMEGNKLMAITVQINPENINKFEQYYDYTPSKSL